MENELFKCINCDNIATWYYMPYDGNDEDEYHIEESFYCDDCVSRGCSCNNESIYYDEKNETPEELIYQCENLRNDINHNNYIMVNYGKIEHCSEKELETITDIKMIRSIVNNVTNEQLRHFTFKPLDEKGREYPCCEFDYSKDGYLKSDFLSEEVE